MTRLGDFIRERRGDLGMTRAALAREMRVHKAQITRWEDGTWRPRSETMARLASVLGIESVVLWQLVAGDLEGSA